MGRSSLDPKEWQDINNEYSSYSVHFTAFFHFPFYVYELNARHFLGQFMARTGRMSPSYECGVMEPVIVIAELVSRLKCVPYCWPMGKYMHFESRVQ